MLRLGVIAKEFLAKEAKKSFNPRLLVALGQLLRLLHSSCQDAGLSSRSLYLRPNTNVARILGNTLAGAGGSDGVGFVSRLACVSAFLDAAEEKGTDADELLEVLIQVLESTSAHPLFPI